MVSPLTRQGNATARAAAVDGAAIGRAERKKRRRYPELLSSPFGRLVVLACEVGGRWSDTSLRFVAGLAKHKLGLPRRSCAAQLEPLGFRAGWGLLSIAAQSALAATLTGDGVLALGGPAGFDEVPLGDVLDHACGAPPPSRLPLRA